MRDGVCLSPEQLAKAGERAEAALSLEKLFGKELAGLREGGVSAISKAGERADVCGWGMCV